MSFFQNKQNRPWIILGLYLFIALFFSLVYYFQKESFENLNSFIDSIYFSVITLTTLGYGDILPVTNIAKSYVILESIFGVILLGFFLISTSSLINENRERKRIETQKSSFKEQYKIWRANTVNALLYLSETNLPYKEIQELYNKDKFRDYFNENESQKWYDVANSLSYDNLYTKELLYELEFLQRNIETLIMQIPIENLDSLNRLNNYINGLYKMRKYDLNEHDDRKTFMRTLWELITLWDFSTGTYDIDYLLDTVNSL